MLGRFLHSLNQFCHEAYDMRYSVSDYWVYDFAKVGQGRCILLDALTTQSTCDENVI